MVSVNVDLHFHSSYAGGTGSLSLEDFSKYAPLKGIHLVGTGDVQFIPWRKTLEEKLIELEDNNEGLFGLKTDLNEEKRIKFLLQTEIIFTTALKGTKKRKQSHTLILFPDYESVDRFYHLAENWGSKLEKMARPFILCKSPQDVGEKLESIKNISSLIEIIPAHVLTPDGVFGSNHKLNWLEEFYGEGVNFINIIETGLSADPKLLSLIPEFDNLTFLSNSDAHSASIQRIGREFTALNVSNDNYSYKDIIHSLRNNKVDFTAEFMPSEGRYFLTGHKRTTKGHEKNKFCRFSPKYSPGKNICPICNKELTEGALSRAIHIGKAQGEERLMEDYPHNRNFFHFIPLIETIAFGKKIKNPNSKSVIKTYMQIVNNNEINNESNLWQLSTTKLLNILLKEVEKNVLDAIVSVRSGNFSYRPGYDGIYGELVIGSKIDYLNIKEVDLGN
ncbi:MAG: hypothetical protein HeimC3_23700 [Candidatus Heimdallarchaeota archaeon LC_3]|nr:MAG: hypothetical protein HeimC3_23700 [Candidatus Heimdallarchaeota archaeon LC_3]